MRITSPLKKCPGWVELPDPDDVFPSHWRDWKNYQKGALGGDADREVYQVFLVGGVQFIAQHGQWGLEKYSPDDFATSEGLERVPVRVQAWLNRQLEAYFVELLDPKD